MPATARRYADRLETNNPEEDALFMLWYKGEAVLKNYIEVMDSFGRAIGKGWYDHVYLL
jgi:hypothetical protein